MAAASSSLSQAAEAARRQHLLLRTTASPFHNPDPAARMGSLSPASPNLNGSEPIFNFDDGRNPKSGPFDDSIQTASIRVVDQQRHAFITQLQIHGSLHRLAAVPLLPPPFPLDIGMHLYRIAPAPICGSTLRWQQHILHPPVDQGKPWQPDTAEQMADPL
ncbi:hypothetical protein ACLOJK_036987 [Asimina triloba]